MDKDSKKNSKKAVKLKKLTPEEQLKWEVAKEIGLSDKVLADGWRSLSAKESGRIGGIVASRKKQLKQHALSATNNTDEI